MARSRLPGAGSRTIYVTNGSIWEAAQAKATTLNRSLSDVILALLVEWLRSNTPIERR